MFGFVKWFNDLRGFGFVNKDDSDDDIFVHYSQIVYNGYKTLKTGSKVQFDLVKTDKGPQAHNVVEITKGN